MKLHRVVPLSLAGALVLAGCSGSDYQDPVVARPAANSVDAPSVAIGLNDAGYDIFHAVAGKSQGDVVLSPISIGLAFGMLDLGASGTVSDALDRLFRYPVAGDARWSAFNTLQQATASDPRPAVKPTSTYQYVPPAAPTVTIANRLFRETKYDVVPAYADNLQKWFGAGIEPTDFVGDPSGSRGHINGWVKDLTKGLIPSLIPEGSITDQTRLVLVNALYLKATWQSTFEPSATSGGTFTHLDGSTTTVPFMHDGSLNASAAFEAGYSAVDLPYANGDLSMLVIVPDAGKYAAVEAGLGTDFVSGVDAALQPTTLNLAFPKFKSESQIGLKDVIQGDLGITGLFNAGGLDGIGQQIEVADAVHAAKITVNEEGTEAAAATAIMMDATAMPVNPVPLNIDRPFLYLIRDHATGAVLFVGRVLEPTA
jgi:serpin B